MWVWGNASLGLWEFEEAQVTTENCHVVPTLTPSGRVRKGMLGRYSLALSPLKVIAAVARSGVTLSPSSKIGFWRSLAATGRFQEACVRVAGASGNELRATPDLLVDLRDSSRTALAGDMGQAITWLLAIEHLKYSSVVDFGRGCTLINPIPAPAPKASDKRPDFMATNSSWKSLILLESKGMIMEQMDNSVWRSGLVEGLEQTEAGTDWLIKHGASASVSNEYAVAFALIEKDASLAVFVDPENEPEGNLNSETSLGFWRTHIATWAAAAGCIRLADALIQDESRQTRIGRIDELGEFYFRNRKMKVARPDQELMPFACTRPMTHLIDSELLMAVVNEELEAADKALAAFRDMMPVEAGGIEQFGENPDPQGWQVPAVFSDGTVYLDPRQVLEGRRYPVADGRR